MSYDLLRRLRILEALQVERASLCFLRIGKRISLVIEDESTRRWNIDEEMVEAFLTFERRREVRIVSEREKAAKQNGRRKAEGFHAFLFLQELCRSSSPHSYVECNTITLRKAAANLCTAQVARLSKTLINLGKVLKVIEQKPHSHSCPLCAALVVALLAPPCATRDVEMSPGDVADKI